jgi:uncharacterized membrane-anchored protein
VELLRGRFGDLETKPWYQSKAVWTGVVAVLIAVYNAIGTSLAPNLGWMLPPIPEWVFGILAAFGVYFRTTVTTKIG